MKRLAMVVMFFALGGFVLGCGGDAKKPTKKTDKAKTEAKKDVKKDETKKDDAKKEEKKDETKKEEAKKTE